MFCQKCGKEIHNEAVVCIHCGCAVGGVAAQAARSISSDYSKFKEIQEDVKVIHTLGVLSLVFCLGIGLIFQIINLVKIGRYKQYWNKEEKRYVFPIFDFADHREVAEYDSTARKIRRASIMTAIGFGISFCLILEAVIFWIISI